MLLAEAPFLYQTTCK